MIFTESGNPTIAPASLLLRLTDGTIEGNGWTVDTLLGIFRAVASRLRPNVGELYDEEQRARPEYDARMFAFDMRRVPLGLYWINYYSAEWVRNIGAQRIDRLRPLVPRFEVVSEGDVLIAIQEEPYQERIPAHRESQRRLEDLLGLRELHAAFPNPGI